jgi:hypothetical protein
MGCSAKKKREKKKDFQVSRHLGSSLLLLTTPSESKAQGGKSTAKGSYPDGYHLPIKRLETVYAAKERANGILQPSYSISSLSMYQLLLRPANFFTTCPSYLPAPTRNDGTH